MLGGESLGPGDWEQKKLLTLATPLPPESGSFVSLPGMKATLPRSSVKSVRRRVVGFRV